MLSASTAAAAAAVANCHAEQQAPIIPSLQAVHAVHASSSGGGSSGSGVGCGAGKGSKRQQQQQAAVAAQLKGMPLHALLAMSHPPIALEWGTDAAGHPAASAQVVQAAVAAHEKCTDKSCPFCSLDPGSVQQAVLAFKQALEAAMKGQGPLPLIEIAQDASTITAAAAAIAGSSSAASALLSSQLNSLTGSSSTLLASVGAGGCSSSGGSSAGGKAKQQAAASTAAAAAAANSQQLFAKGGWMEVFRGKLGKAAAKLAGSAAAAGVAGSSGGGIGSNVQDVQQPLSALNSRDLLEVLAVRAAAAGGLAADADAEEAEGFEDAQEDADTSDGSLGALVSEARRVVPVGPGPCLRQGSSSVGATEPLLMQEPTRSKQHAGGVGWLASGGLWPAATLFSQLAPACTHTSCCLSCRAVPCCGVSANV